MKEFVDWKLSQCPVSVSLLVDSEFICTFPVTTRDPQPLLSCTFNNCSFLRVARLGCLACLCVHVTHQVDRILFFWSGVLFCNYFSTVKISDKQDSANLFALTPGGELRCLEQSVHQKPSSVLFLREAESACLKHVKNNDILRYLFPRIGYKYIFIMR